MDILFVTSAISPYHPSSELGDVSRALAKALRGLGHRVTVLSPLHAGVDPAQHALGRKLSTLDVEVAGETRECIVLTGRTTGGVELVFISHDATFPEPTGEAPSAQTRAAAITLCHAAAHYAAGADGTPDVVLAHGVDAALAPALCQARGIACAAVFSAGEPALAGEFSADEVASWNLPDDLAAQVSALGSLRAAGMATARTVVSSQGALAALEVPEGAAAPIAIASAVDASVWNPLTDAALEARFDPANQDGKDRCKGALQYAADLAIRPETPLLGIVGAGGDALLMEVAEGLLRNDVQVAIGIEGDEAPEALSPLFEKYEDRVRPVDVSTEDGLHQLVGGSDLLLLTPDACGRGTLHLSAQRYGTLPIVMADSLAAELVVDCDAQLETGNGFVYREGGLAGTLARGVAAHASSKAFQALRTRVMRIDTSWDRAARRHEHLFRQALPGEAEAEAS